MKDLSFYRGKRIAVIGASVEGLVTAKYLLEHDLQVWVCDQKEKAHFGNSLEPLLSRGAKFNFGPNYLAHLSSFDIVFRTPGMPTWSEALLDAKKKGVYISSQTKLFFELCPGPIIGVTGTKGKGTTTSLIGQILKAAGRSVYVGGNIGLPPLSFLDNLTPHSYAVLELSSFQLEDLACSPHIAVVLMITQEHLASHSKDNPNYHRTLEEYLLGKQNIVRYQKHRDFAIINADYPRSLLFEELTLARKLFFSKQNKVLGAYLDGSKIYFNDGKKSTLLSDTKKAKLLGLHNRENMMAAALVGKALGIESRHIIQSLLTFPGLEHRLEPVGKIDGVYYINDSFATTPEATIAAVCSFTQPIVLILGGSDKGSNYKSLAKVVSQSSVSAVILIGQMAETIRESLQVEKYRGKIVAGGKNMQAIVGHAQKIAKKGNVVLLSPACASFDMFTNYKERGKLFKYEVAKI